MKTAKGANNSGSVWLVKRKTLPDYWRGSVTLPDGSKTYVKHEVKEVCQALVEELVGRVAKGEIVRSTVVGTVEQECRAWLERRTARDLTPKKKKLTASSYRTYTTAIDSLLCRSADVRLNIGKINAGKLMPAHVQNWLDDLAAAGISGNYVRQAYSALSQTYDGLVSVHAVADNPLRVIDRPARTEAKGHGIEGEELDELMNVLVGHRFHLRWWIAFVFGVRPAEAIAVRRKDVQLNLRDGADRRYGLLHIRGQIDNTGRYIPHTKSKRPRTLKLNEEAIEKFEDHLDGLDAEKQSYEDEGGQWAEFHQDDEHHDFIFRRPGGRNLTVGTDTAAWQAIAKDVGLEGKPRYIARHTAASHLIGNGVDPLVAAEILGHRNPMITLNVYGHALDKGKSAATDTMTRLMGAAKQRGREATLTAGGGMSLGDLRDQLREMGLNTAELDARIEAEEEDMRGVRPRRTARGRSSS